MVKSPLISMITVVRNGAAHMEQCIKSVLEQAGANLEYIVVDGGSTDGTVEIIKKYEGKITAWISEKDKGISDAFNKGIAMAKGNIIGLINSDDWLEPGVLARIAAFSDE